MRIVPSCEPFRSCGPYYGIRSSVHASAAARPRRTSRSVPASRAVDEEPGFRKDLTMKTALELRHLRAFVMLVEHGGITAAALALEHAQSTVSEALAALERSLGAELIVRGRGSNSARPTAAGLALLPHAR